MKPQEVAPDWSTLLGALEIFDAAIAPVGLYAAEEYQMRDKPQPRLKVEWEKCLKPEMKQLGCNPAGRVSIKANLLSAQFQSGTKIRWLHVIRVSKIKVRKYGDSYRVDPHHDFSERWHESNPGHFLNDLWKFRKYGNGLVLLVGFSAEREPFSNELAALQSGTAFRQRFDQAIVRCWDDPHNRAFKIMTALWHVK